MSFIARNNKAPQSAIIPAIELDRMAREYQEAMRKTAELVKINAEREIMFGILRENFDLLLEENEMLRKMLNERDLRIKEVEKELKRLKRHKKGPSMNSGHRGHISHPEALDEADLV